MKMVKTRSCLHCNQEGKVLLTPEQYERFQNDYETILI